MSDQQNLSMLIVAAVAAKMTPEFIEKEVNSRVEKLVVETIDRAFRTYSDLGGQIETAVKEALKVERLDLPSYGGIVTMMLKAQIEACVAPIVAGRLAADMEALLKLAPKEIKLSAVAEEMIEHRTSWDSELYGEIITVIVERNDYGSAWVYLDERAHHEESRKRDCEVSMLVSKDGTISSATFSGRDLASNRHVGSSYGLEQKIRAWVACGTVLVLDEDAVVTSTGDY